MPREILAGAEVHQDDAAAGLAHDVLRLDVAVQQPGAVDGRERGADVEADERGLAGAERSACLTSLVERLAAHELGPEADPAIVLLGAVDLDDVLVPQPREATGFFHDPRARVARTVDQVVLVQQLQRNVAVELGVPGAEDVAGRSLADGSRRTRRPHRRPSGLAGVATGASLSVGRDAPVQGSDAVDESKVADDPTVAARSCGLNRLPIDRAAVRHRCSEVRERAIVSPQQILNRQVLSSLTGGIRGFKGFKVQGPRRPLALSLGLGRSIGFGPFGSGAHATPRGGRPTPAAYRTDSEMPSMPRSRSITESAKRHHAEGREAEAGGGQAERLADVPGLDERGAIRARIRVAPQDAREDRR